MLHSQTPKTSKTYSPNRILERKTNALQVAALQEHVRALTTQNERLIIEIQRLKSQQSTSYLVALQNQNARLELEKKDAENKLKKLTDDHSAAMNLMLMVRELEKEQKPAHSNPVSKASDNKPKPKPQPLSNKNPNTETKKKNTSPAEKPLSKSPRFFSAKAREAAGLQPIRSKTPTLNRPAWR